MVKKFNYPEDGVFNRLVSMIKSKLAKVAFTGSYIDLTNKPSIPAAVAVKGNNEAAYRTGNVNLTPANIGAFPGTIEIPNGANLNNYTTPGVYSGSGSFSYSNSPIANTSFVLIVAKGGNFIRQTFLSVNAVSSGEYSRYFNPSNSTWIAWEPNVIQVKGDKESAYRGGLVNLSPANIGALSLAGGTVTEKVGFRQGTIVHEMNSPGSSGYFHICQIKVSASASYMNQVMVFRVLQRNRWSGTIELVLTSSITTNVGIQDIKKYGSVDAFVAKTATSTFDLYVRKAEAWDGLCVASLEKGTYMNDVQITWTSDSVTSLPNGYVEASWMPWNGRANEASSLATKNVGSGSQPVYFSNGVPVVCSTSLSSLQNEIDELNTHIGSWENITGSCNFGYIQGSYGIVYRNEKLRMIFFVVIADNVINNQSPILGIGMLPGDASPIVLGIAVHETTGVSVDLKNAGHVVRSSHSKDIAISGARYLGILIF